MTRIRVALLILGYILSWSILELLVPLSGVSLLEVVWARCTLDVIGMLFFFTGLRFKGVKALVQTSHLGSQICRSFALLGMSLFSLWAVRGISVTDALCILWGMPLVIILLDRLFLHEVSGWKIPVITICGYLGVLLIARPVFTWNWDDLLALMGAVSLAVYIILTRALRHEMIMPKLFHTALWSSLALTPFIPFFWKAPTLHGWIILIGVAAFGWIMLFLLCRSLETTPSAIFAPAIYGMTACLHLANVMEHHEAATRGLRIGMLIIWGAVFAILLIKWPTRHQSWVPEAIGDT